MDPRVCFFYDIKSQWTGVYDIENKKFIYHEHTTLGYIKDKIFYYHPERNFNHLLGDIIYQSTDINQMLQFITDYTLIKVL